MKGDFATVKEGEGTIVLFEPEGAVGGDSQNPSGGKIGANAAATQKIMLRPEVFQFIGKGIIEKILQGLGKANEDAMCKP